MLGFKGFTTVAITIAGIELDASHPGKGQFGTGTSVQGRLAPASGMPGSKLEVSTAQHGTLFGAGWLHYVRRTKGYTALAAGRPQGFSPSWLIEVLWKTILSRCTLRRKSTTRRSSARGRRTYPHPAVIEHSQSSRE